jgi:histidine triad (HIT) family protein
MMNTTDCPFCKIIRGDAPASVVAENENLISFMTLRPTRPGECLVVPKQHIDHFTDIPDETAAALMVMAQAIGRVMRNEFHCQRVGMVVHGSAFLMLIS